MFDALQVMQEMRTVTREAETDLRDTVQDADEWIQQNPMSVATEREVSVQTKGIGSVYRCLFVKRPAEEKASSLSSEEQHSTSQSQ